MLRTLGSANPVQTRYNYYSWNTLEDGGKLQQIYTTRGTAVLQNFQYDYDSNSNITDILDYVMGSPQTQNFQYDNLDRLTSAGAANGTEGNYGPEGYSYDSATGNLANKGSSTYNYGAQSAGCPDGALDKAHAAVTAGDNFYCYDLNGNMVQRVISDTNYITYTLSYDAENHMIGYSGGTVSANFVYDGDGRRVQATVNGVTTKFVGSHVEWQSSTTDMVRYYYAGGVRVAMRTGDDGLVWLVGDHLGSTSIAVTDASGVTEYQGYKAWGETRFGNLPTKYRYTGQHEYDYINLYWYNSRWMDPELGRFVQADTIIPDNYHPLDWDRYSYVRNNPVRYQDPSGHKACDGENEDDCRAPLSGLTPEERLDSIASRYNVTFGGNWSLAYKRIILKAVMLVGAALASAAGVYMTAWGAFNAVYGSVRFLYDNSGGAGGEYLGYLNGAHTITFSGFFATWRADYITLNIRLAIHELGHAFDGAVGRARGGNQWTDGARTDMDMGVLSRDGYEDSYGGFWGFAGGREDWQFSLLDENFGRSGEVFADMFLGWVYGTWGGEPYGPDRQAHMNEWMDVYLGLFLTQ